jgi:hypothetical protein
MAVQQLGPESSRAGARRARALAARAGGPTVALVALSTVTVTSLVAIAFAPLPHAVSPGVGGGVAAPSNVRALAPAKVIHSPEAPTVKKPKTTGSSFTSTPPAAGGGTTSSGRTGGTTTHSSGGSSAVGNGSHGSSTGGGSGSGGPTRPGSGTGSGSTGGHGDGTGTAGVPVPSGPPTSVCDPEHPDGDDAVPTVDPNADTNKNTLCVIPTPVDGWHSGGGHVIVFPRTTPVALPGGSGDGDETGGSGSGTSAHEGGATGGTTTEGSPAPTKPRGHSGTLPGSVTPPTTTTSAVVTPAAQVDATPTVKAVVPALVKALAAPTTAATAATDTATATSDSSDTAKDDSTTAKPTVKAVTEHRTYGEHRTGGKHRA